MPLSEQHRQSNRIEVLADGPWPKGQITHRWREDAFIPSAEASAAADLELEKLRQKGSPSHDGYAARLAGFKVEQGQLELELQPIRWSLRLVPDDSFHSLSVLCVTRSHDGRWLAGHRASWLATWSDRWALGAAGSVETGENPVDTLSRELAEEWSVKPVELTTEALIMLPKQMAMLLGVAWLAEDAVVTPDSEHDDFEWWPEDVNQWPEHADDALRLVGKYLSR